MLGADAARTRALDRPRLHMSVRVDAEKALGRRADHRRVRKVEKRGERRRVLRAAAGGRAPTVLVRAAPRIAATGWPGRCRPRRCTRARARRRRDTRARERRANRQARIPPAAFDGIGGGEGKAGEAGSGPGEGVGRDPAGPRPGRLESRVAHAERARTVRARARSRAPRSSSLGHAGRDQPRA